MKVYFGRELGVGVRERESVCIPKSLREVKRVCIRGMKGDRAN